ncbi:DNAJ heat shock N-terminal domain-containing protein [Wolffia australiana]
MWRRGVRELLIFNGSRNILGRRSESLRRSCSLEWRRDLRRGEWRGRGGSGGFAGPSWRLYCSSGVSAAERGGGGAAGTGRCWNCGAPPPAEPFLVCAACASVQPVDPSLDFFQIFSLEREYDVRVGELERKYKDWQKMLHPDLVHTKSEREKCYAADQSARVITAFSTLCKPLSRAIYMLQLEGLQVEDEGTITDPDLLSEVMEIREAVEEAEDSQTLNQIKSTSEEKMELWSTFFGGAFKNRQFKDAAMAIQRMTYYQRAVEEIIKKL